MEGVGAGAHALRAEPSRLLDFDWKLLVWPRQTCVVVIVLATVAFLSSTSHGIWLPYLCTGKTLKTFNVFEAETFE